MGSNASSLSALLTAAWERDRGLTSPKRRGESDRGADWYPYYAGYADTFVAEVVESLPELTGTLLDPWNGAGTTTSVAAARALPAEGFDINPAAVVISKARLLRSDVASSLAPLTKELLNSVEPATDVADDDLLLNWMTERAATSVRRLAATINRAMVTSRSSRDVSTLASEMSSLAALFYLGLFRVVRGALSGFGSTNPTWLKLTVPEGDRIDIDLRTFRPSLVAEMTELASILGSRGLSNTNHSRVGVAVADSGSLPLNDQSVQAVIASPPYCTRIDYAVATAPELATLGMNATDFRALRDQLIGTPTRDGSFPRSGLSWGKTATTFLSDVASHGSRASVGYYLPFFCQYFAGMWDSLAEVDRVVERGGPIVLVVQDSYYKEVHADIPGVMADMARSLGWESLARRDFQVKTRGNINPASRKYREPVTATEAVLAFSR